MRRRRLLRAVMLGAIAWACVLPAARGRAAPARFVPWKGGKTPPLALHDLAGRRRTLADYRGKIVLVNFWATWCEPCRDEIPTMQKLQERLAGRPFAILAVNFGESESRVSEFVQRMGVDFPVLLDPNRDAPGPWRVRVLPASFLVGADGSVRYSVIGEVDWTGAEATDAIRRLLG